MDREVLLKQLSKNVVTISFTKKDGTERIMNCTRCFDIIPIEFHPKGESKKESEFIKESESTDLINVFDVEKNGWRSFNFLTVKNP